MKKPISKKPRVVVIVGPTGVGKTSLSIKLAKHLKGEIISADSRQVYKGLDIGTEKISKKEMAGIAHHMIDVCSPKKVFNAEDFRLQGEKALQSILSRDHMSFIVGGTGFYISALLNGKQTPEVPPNISLRKKLEKFPIHKLYALLQKKDPRRALNIDAKNPRRLIRALEIIDALGKVPPLVKTDSAFDALWIGILPPKKYEENLQLRLHKQIKKGLLAEIKLLQKQGVTKKRLNEFGLEYRTGLQHIDGHITKAEMKEKMLLELRQYAKRQMTWFKTNKAIHWFPASTPVKTILEALSI